jgi:vancomycin resistance protein YoaR
VNGGSGNGGPPANGDPAWPTREPVTTRLPVADPSVTAQPRAFVPADPDPPTEPIAPLPRPPSDGARRPWWRRVPVLTGAAVVAGLGLLYAADLALSSGDLPRGTVVAGVRVGGLSRAEAQDRLAAQIGPRLASPVQLRAGDLSAQFDPAAAGLHPDWPATLDRAAGAPLDPIHRLTSLWTDTAVPVVTTGDPRALRATVDGLRPALDRDAVEGGIRFDGATPVPVDPHPGQAVDPDTVLAVVRDHWADGAPVVLPVTARPVRTSAAAVADALDRLARPAVAAPLTVTGEGGRSVTLAPATLAGALSIVADDSGALRLVVDPARLDAACRPTLGAADRPGTDATIVIDSGHPVVKPSADGRTIDYPALATALPPVLARPADRTVAAPYHVQPAALTTEQAAALGVREVIGQFSTGGFAADSGTNIRQVAGEVDGALVKPGATFSLNGYTGPRGAAQGYVEAGVIENGRPDRAIGGGISQFATTLYNASYFAGMTDAGHKEHSFYISRYPAAREATVFEGAIDLKFTNSAKTAVLIETSWAPSSITVRLWGTKTVEVQSVTGPRTAETQPPTITVDEPGKPCKPSTGAVGFTTSDTRIIKDAATGAELRRSTRTVTYNPSPKIVCGPPPPAAPPGQPVPLVPPPTTATPGPTPSG